MTVLDVAIPTGYFMQQQKLDNYVLGQRVRNLKRAKYEEKRVLFYFDYVSKVILLDCLDRFLKLFIAPFSWTTTMSA